MKIIIAIGVLAVFALGAGVIWADGPIPGDANGDGIVNIKDFGILRNSFAFCAGDAGFDARVDFDQSGCVDILDFGILRANYLRTE